MELQGERLLPATVETTWAALNDPEVLKSCIANCESLVKSGEDTLDAVVAMKVGPVSARFKGKLTLTNVQAPTGYTIVFDGQGGMAGFGKGSADVSLAPSGEGQTTLTYLAKATVGGKIAQIGSRLIDAAAAKITNDFFTAFATRLEARATELAGGSTTGFGTAVGGSGLGDGAADAGISPGRALRLADAAGGPTGCDPAGVPAASDSAGTASAGVPLDPAIVKLAATAGAAVVLGAIYFLIR